MPLKAAKSFDFHQILFLTHFLHWRSSGQKLDVIEVTQNEDLQKFKIRVVLETANRLLGIPAKWANIKWTVEGIHSKQLIQLIHFLVALIRHYRAPIRLPQNVTVNLVVVQVNNPNIIWICEVLICINFRRNEKDDWCRAP